MVRHLHNLQRAPPITLRPPGTSRGYCSSVWSLSPDSSSSLRAVCNTLHWFIAFLILVIVFFTVRNSIVFFRKEIPVI